MLTLFAILTFITLLAAITLPMIVNAVNNMIDDSNQLYEDIRDRVEALLFEFQIEKPILE